MAADLGFLVTTFTESRQYVRPTKDVDSRKIREIADELQLPYLTILDAERPLPRLRLFFEQTLGNRAAATGARWKVAAPVVLEYAKKLRTESPSPVQRLEAIRELRQDVEGHLAKAGFTDEMRSWSLPDLDDL
jgi:hypothetical protein